MFNDQLLIQTLCDADKRTNERIWELSSKIYTRGQAEEKQTEIEQSKADDYFEALLKEE